MKPVRYEYNQAPALGVGGAEGTKFIGLPAQDLEQLENAAFMVQQDKVSFRV